MFRDRAIETVQAGFTGTGTYNLGGAATNAQTLEAAFGTGATLFYLTRTATWTKVEMGWGVVTSGTLTRNVLRSFNGTVWGTAAVSWISGDHPLYVYSVPLGEALASMLKTNAGTSRPAWLPQWGTWLDTNTPSGTVVTLNLFDGADDIAIGTFDITANTFTPTGLGDVLHLAGGTMTGPIRLDDAVTTPGATIPLAFDGDPDTGMVRTAANVAKLVAGGAAILEWNTTGVLVSGNVAASGYIAPGNDANFSLLISGPNPVITLDSTDDFYYDRAANTFIFRVGAAAVATITSALGVTAKNTPRAGASFTFTAGVPTTLRSFNIASWTDHATGDITANLTTAMVTNDPILLTGGHRYTVVNSGVPVYVARNSDRTMTSTAIPLWVSSYDGTAIDGTQLSFAVIEGA